MSRSPTRVLSEELDGQSPGETGSLTPGTHFAQRYRIVALLGRGGMGLVYRADDLRLGQPVALKVLAPEFAKTPERMEALRGEVRNAHRVTHPNVCRVHDLGETEGQPFLSMEFVDGEDLASLLRRIGRLAPDKALEIAHQICAGVAAAHEHGVIHRDLKPANVMIDGRGQAKITDFGLALGPTDVVRKGEVAGTLAYMAPEQRTGSPATARSDVYALGLILYELFTGRAAFPATTALPRRSRASIVPPSQHVTGLDPAVEKVILDCLEEDPAARPASAGVLSSLLPGGGALALAIAAGATPRPEIVAAAGSGPGPGAGACWGALAVYVFSIVLCLVLTPRVGVVGLAHLTKSPEVLAEKARDVAAAAGYAGQTDHEAWYFMISPDVADVLRRPARRTPEAAGEPLLRFHFRQSPEVMVSMNPFRRLSDTNPPLTTPGMVNIRLAPDGRLLRMVALAPRAATGLPLAEPDWSVFFRAAGLAPANFRPEEPSRLPETPFDLRRAWRSVTGAELICAATLGGRLVSFEVVSAPRDRALQSKTGSTAFASSGWYFVTVTLAFMLLTGLLARKNVRLGRSDGKAAVRLAVAAGLLRFAEGASGAPHSYGTAWDFFFWLRSAIGSALFSAGIMWILYLALEPYARRHWPRLLLGWSRLVGGSLRDRRIGTELLFGVTVGAAGTALTLAIRLLADTPLGLGLFPAWSDLPSLLGTRHALSRLLAIGVYCLVGALFATCSLAVGYSVLRNRILAIFIAAVLMGGVAYKDTEPWLPLLFSTILVVLATTIAFGVLVRFGTLAAWLCLWTASILGQMPMGTGGSSWTLQTALLPVGLTGAVAIFGFWTARGGERIVPGLLGDDE